MVLRHNDGSPGHIISHEEFEKDLREFTARESQNQFVERNREAMERANAAVRRSQRIHAQCEALDVRVNDALLLGSEVSVAQIQRKNKRRPANE